MKVSFNTNPYPITITLLNRSQSASGTFIVFVIGIGFSLIPAAIMSFIVSEREKNLRHMQLISGMNISSYWVSNMIFDILKAEIPMVAVICLIYIFGLGVSFLCFLPNFVLIVR
jgi:ATP-binding cassette subfamily A (ABC1) protein 3